MSSLFRPSPGEYVPLHGLRALSSLLILTLHILSLQHFFFPHPSPLSAQYPASAQRWSDYLSHSPQALVYPLLGMAIETFFVLSSFLLTIKLLNTVKREGDRLSFFSYLSADYPSLLWARALRLWPGIVFSVFICHCLGEIPSYSAVPTYLADVFFFLNYLPFSLTAMNTGPHWSISLDFQFYCVFPLVFIALWTIKKKLPAGVARFFCLPLLFFLIMPLSVLYGIYAFYYLAPSLSQKLNLFHFIHSLSLFGPQMIEWVRDKCALDGLEAGLDYQALLDTGAAREFTKYIYFPFSARVGSFVPGVLAAWYVEQFSEGQKRGNNAEGEQGLRAALTWIKSWLFFFLSLSLPVCLLFAPPPANAIASRDDVIGLIALRPLFACAVSFILFQSVVPPSHPYSSSFLRSLFSFPLFVPFSRLSYPIYLLHWALAFELLKPSIFGPLAHFIRYNQTAQAAAAWAAGTLAITTAFALIYYFAIETPIERWRESRREGQIKKKI